MLPKMVVKESQFLDLCQKPAKVNTLIHPTISLEKKLV
jgi:hypothetical protein